MRSVVESFMLIVVYPNSDNVRLKVRGEYKLFYTCVMCVVPLYIYFQALTWTRPRMPRNVKRFQADGLHKPSKSRGPSVVSAERLSIDKPGLRGMSHSAFVSRKSASRVDIMIFLLAMYLQVWC